MNIQTVFCEVGRNWIIQIKLKFPYVNLIEEREVCGVWH
jgi:hypothetical protein